VKVLEFKEFAETRWNFLDTNCLSYLVKNFGTGIESEETKGFQTNPLLITQSQLMEMSKDTRLVEKADQVLNKFQVFVLSDVFAVWEAEIGQYLKQKSPRFKVYRFQGPTKDLVNRPDFITAVSTFHQNIDDDFSNMVSGDIGTNIDERDLNVVVVDKICGYAREWFGSEVPLFASPSIFRGFYTYFYTYFFRYIKKQEITVSSNDAVDLANTIVAPYCRRYCAEHSFASTLKEFQGRFTSTVIAIAKRGYMTGRWEERDWDFIRKHRSLFDKKYKLLSGVEILSYRNFIKLFTDDEK